MMVWWCVVNAMLVAILFIVVPCEGACTIEPDEEGRVEIPLTWTNITRKAFFGCISLHSVEIPHTVTSIGESAFMGSGLWSIGFPQDSVIRIGDRAFSDCLRLTQIVIPASISYIGDEVFSNSSALNYVKIESSSSVTFGSSPFLNCTSLSEDGIVLRKGVSINGNSLGSEFAVQCDDGNQCGCMPGYGNKLDSTSDYFNCAPCPEAYANANVPPSYDACQLCPQGTYSSIEKSNMCTGCPAGKFGAYDASTSESDCQDCYVGQYMASSKGFKDCNDCPPGNFCNESGLEMYFSCAPGTYQNQSGADRCLSCPPGRYHSGYGGAVCNPCPAGHYNPNYGSIDDSSCLSCADGKYVDYEGASVCKICGKDTYTATMSGKHKCQHCSGGTTTAGVTTDGTGASYCVVDPSSLCSPGEERDKSTSQCVACLPGMFSADGAACITCPRGSYNTATNSAFCTKCPMGTFGEIQGSSSIYGCVSCPKGTFNAYTGATSCTSCSIGKYGAKESGTSAGHSCVACPIGKYMDHTGASSCTNCPPGSSCPHIEMSEASPCAPGKFTDLPGQAECAVCPAGRFQAQEGAAFCTFCGKGKYGTTEGAAQSSLCADCSPGKFSHMNGSTSCLECPAGQYQASSGQFQCIPCNELGTSTDDRKECVGSTSQKQALYLVFGEGVALYSAFIAALFFVVVGLLVESNRHAKEHPHLARLGYLRVVLKTFLTGFVFGAEIFIIYGIWTDAQPLAVTILMFRLFHLIGSTLVTMVVFSPSKDVVVFVSKFVRGAEDLRDCIDRDFVDESFFWRNLLSVLSSFDMTMLVLFPWNESAFFVISGGYPTMGLFTFVAVVKISQSALAIVAEIAYLSTYSNLDDETTNSQADALFAISITFLLWEVLYIVGTYVEYGDRLRDIERSFHEDKNIVLDPLPPPVIVQSKSDYVPDPQERSAAQTGFDFELSKVKLKGENPMHKAPQKPSRPIQPP